MNARTRTGVLLALGSALGGAAFLSPFKAAGALAPENAVVCVTLGAAAMLNSIISLGGALGGAGGRLRIDRLACITALLLAVLTTTGNVGVSRALGLIDAGVTSVTLQTQVLFVALGAWLLIGERITARFMIGAFIVLAGFAVMRLPVSGGAALSVTGLLWALGGAASFAIMNVITRQVIDRIQPVAVNAMRLWLAASLLLLVPGTAAAVVEMDARTWLLCTVAAFIGPFLGRICIMYAVSYIPASHATLVNLAGPLFAFLLDYILFGSTPSGRDLVGGVVILVGVCVPIAELAGTAPAVITHDGAATPGQKSGPA